MSDTRETWKIRINGYGTFEFKGTESEAEDMRAHKAKWEHGTGIKWRVKNQTPVDEITEEMADLWDEHKGVPSALMAKLRKAKETLVAAAAKAVQAEKVDKS